MRDLTAEERERYASGSWLAGGERCSLCGDARSNHDQDGPCSVCSCSEYVSDDEDA